MKTTSREIKFRAWDLDCKEMLYKVTVESGANSEYLMQYTGLKDKNGKEIYEGDILRVKDGWGNDTVHEVKWGNPNELERNWYPAFDLEPSWDEEFNSFSAIFGGGDAEIEVIGNIYENPDLLS